MKKTLRILFALTFLILGICAIVHPTKNETNILRTIVSEKNQDLLDLSNMYSAKINVLIEGEEPEEVIDTADIFAKKAESNNLKSISVDGNKILEIYKSARGGLLSDKTATLLANKDYKKIKENALEMIYNPMGFSVISPEEDPFLLFTDYVMSLGNNISSDSIITFNEKYYRILNYEFDKNISLSPSLLNKEVGKIIKIQKELSQNDVNVYLTGSPIHSYYASSRSMIEINIICILSSVFIIGLCIFYFKNIHVLIPIFLSLLCGGLVGYFITSLIFPSIHILTFVFSTTLIGISVDYSLHYFVCKKSEISGDDVIKSILKSLTVSLITTVSAFFVLLFSQTELLKQIAVFTITGLVTVYLFVILYFPIICENFNINNNGNIRWNFNFKPVFSKNILIFFGIITLCGFFFIRTNDDIKSMYKPSEKLMQAEILFANVANINAKTSFFIVEGKDLQDVLEKEEKIASLLGKTQYQSLSKYIPSKKLQERNRNLSIGLYDSEISPYTSLLHITAKVPPAKLLIFDKEKFPFLQSFLLDSNKTLMILYDFENPEILKGIEGVEYYNVQKDISDIVQKCRIGCMKLLLPVFILLFAVLASIYKMKAAFRIILPSLLACIVTLSILGLFHISLNLFHVIAFFLIIGFSLDYSIFRFNGEKCVNDAVFMSCMTSVFSFMLLSLTGFKLISSLGFVLAVGLVTSYILSLLLISKE